jgi:putative transposase
MVKLWGRKINDLAFADFILKLKWMCKKFGKQIFFIDRFFPSSKTCHKCGHVNHDLTLKDRAWVCPNCHALLDRDINAAINIYKVGTSTFRLDRVIPVSKMVSVV